REIEDIQYASLSIEAIPVIEEVISTEGLRLVLQNFPEGIRIERTMEAGANYIDNIVPGVYSVTVSGTVESDRGNFFLNGSANNVMILRENETLEIEIDGATVGTFAFSEIFYSGTDPFYFRNQFYEITNNADETAYADGLYFARLLPIAASTSMPIWPEED